MQIWMLPFLGHLQLLNTHTTHTHMHMGGDFFLILEWKELVKDFKLKDNTQILPHLGWEIEALQYFPTLMMHAFVVCPSVWNNLTFSCLTVHFLLYFYVPIATLGFTDPWVSDGVSFSVIIASPFVVFSYYFFWKLILSW